jgi:chromosome segregation ATPase
MSDILDILLDLPLAGSLGPETREAFVRALRDRSEKVLAERVYPLEQQVAVLTSRVAALETELQWRTETVGQLQTAVAALEKESAWRAEAITGLKREVEGLERERERATEAHDLLLGHHRGLVAQVVARLEEMAGLPWWRLPGVRERFREWAASYRRELP